MPPHRKSFFEVKTVHSRESRGCVTSEITGITSDPIDPKPSLSWETTAAFQTISNPQGVQPQELCALAAGSPRETKRADSPPLRTSDSLPVGGRLQFFSKAWEDSRWGLSIVKNGLGWAWKSRPPKNRKFTQLETPALAQYVEEMLEKQVIVKAEHLYFQSRIFSVPKKDSEKVRTILDLSFLNKHIECPHFRMTTVHQVRQILPKNAWTVSLDLSDAFWHVPVAKNFQPYLGFRLQGPLGLRSFSFRVMSFGICLAPYVFTKLTAIVVKQLRLEGINIVVYLDDWLVWSSSPAQCETALHRVMEVARERGFLLNIEKSRLIPARVFQ